MECTPKKRGELLLGQVSWRSLAPWSLLFVGLVFGLLLCHGTEEVAYGQGGLTGRHGIVASAHDLEIVQSQAADGGQVVVVVDTAKRVMSAYHVDATSGKITLRSVRNFYWDLLMDEFNGSEPSPKDIRELLGN